MSRPELENLVRAGLLREEPFSRTEFDGLLRSADKRLRDAKNPDLADDSRFDLAYNAAHSLALAALRAHGFRAENRYVVFQVVPHTLQVSTSDWRLLSKCHDQRNRTEYGGAPPIESKLLAELLVVAETLQGKANEMARPDEPRT